MLGADETRLGAQIDWQKDYVSGIRWEARFHRRIDYHRLDLSCDVKFPWEVSRFQWFLPVAQAYRLTKDESYATAARNLIEDWIEHNPYGRGVNWACAMEVAIRTVAWTWLFASFNTAAAWRDESFRFAFLRALFLSARFIERNLEESDLNSNHYLADAVGLVYAGLLLGHGRRARHWSELGWRILLTEAPRQILADGVDYEGSVAYHRLVMECLYYPALFRRLRGLDVPQAYVWRLAQMARFVAAYSPEDGDSPLVGDADDGRVLPLGGQNLLDHRYLVGLIGAWPTEVEPVGGPADEVYWVLGARAAQDIIRRGASSSKSIGFKNAGFYVMRDARNHVFIDCGSVGLCGRGGHGHNDCLSFEAVLDGVKVITDSGTFTYTRSAHERNRFRSTEAHNTPQIDRRELNRFKSPTMLWNLSDDARPSVHLWRPADTQDVLRASHTGYSRLREPVTVVRTIVLDHESGVLAVEDVLSGSGRHRVDVRLHLDSDVEVAAIEGQVVRIMAGVMQFRIVWAGGAPWHLEVEPARVSPSYGTVKASWRLHWVATIAMPAQLRVCVVPTGVNPPETRDWEKWLEETR